MKRIGLLVGVLTMLFPVTVFAEEDTFMFRNIPWNSTKAEAEELLAADGAEIGYAGFKNDILRLSGIDYLNGFMGDDCVENGGIVGKYTGLKVAGYDVSSAGACYIYTLNDDLTINRDEDSALFYFGWYAFDSRDFADAPGVYDDLSVKLKSIYGEGEENTESDYYDTITWKDADENTIRLLLGGKKKENGKQYVSLGYIAGDADSRLDEMENALYLEEKAVEEAERAENVSDTSGL
jgi:hypothetical protein